MWSLTHTGAVTAVSLHALADEAAAESDSDAGSEDAAEETFATASPDAFSGVSSNPTAPGGGPHSKRSRPSNASHVSASHTPVSGRPALAWK